MVSYKYHKPLLLYRVIGTRLVESDWPFLHEASSAKKARFLEEMSPAGRETKPYVRFMTKYNRYGNYIYIWLLTRFNDFLT
jgi:hypothetical protein